VVDITRCERCGKTIPALDSGCPWCEAADARRPGFREDDWMPLSIRMLLWLFVTNLVVSAALAVFTLTASERTLDAASLVAVAATARLLLAGATLVGIVFRERWGRWLPLSFLAFEGLSFIALQAGVLPADAWIGGWLAPLWNLLFVFLFMRDDVRGRFDRRLADQREVGELIDSFRDEGRPR